MHEFSKTIFVFSVCFFQVNYNVVKAILNLPFQQSGGQQYLSSLRSLLTYFTPILVNYIRNESAMIDCLQAIEVIYLHNKNIIFIHIFNIVLSSDLGSS